MQKQKKFPKPEYTYLTIELIDYRARVDASINYEVRDPHHFRDEAKIYEFSNFFEIEGISTYPEERKGEKFQITIHGSDTRHRDLDLTLKDCHVRDERGTRIYRKVRGKGVPVYDIPKGIGHVQRQRETKVWIGWVWVPQRTVSDMLVLLSNVRPLYLALHELRVGRTRWIVDLTLQTSNPEEE